MGDGADSEPALAVLAGVILQIYVDGLGAAWEILSVI